MKKPIYIYCKDLDEQTEKQFLNCVNKDFVFAAALMPDAHSGYVAPIGSVLITKGVIVPSWVGYDIGCGVTAIKLTAPNLRLKAKENAQKIYDEVSKTVPMGLGKIHSQGDVHKEQRLAFRELLENLAKKPHDKDLFDFIKRKSESTLGTLGEGNHFIELGEGNDSNTDEIWIIIHSGSRNIGHKVATKYMKSSAGDDKTFEQTFPLDSNSRVGEEYLAILEFGLEFALLNRLEMGITVKECIETILNEPITFEVWTNKNHNHAIKETYNGETVYIHRKGATPAKKGERGVIPGNMRDGVYLVEGLGNEKFLWSSSHGAGRKMSRKKAKESISLVEFKESMKGVLGTVREGTIDEAPQAYKDFEVVMNNQKESIKIIKHIKPFINWKGDNKKR